MKQQIKFRVSKDGEVHIEVDGVEGILCEEMTKKFEEALGVKVDVQQKPDYYVCLDDIEQHVHEE